MRALTQAARKVGSGNFDVTVPVNSEFEMGELTAAFNRMAMQLRERQRDDAGAAWRRQSTLEGAWPHCPIPLMVLNPAGQVEFENPAATQLVRERGALPAGVDASIHRALQDDQSLLPRDCSETIQVRLGSDMKWFLPRIILLGHDGSGPAGVVVVLRDLTQFRLLDELKTNLLATVCHEFNTPLTGARMAMHLLLEPQTGRLTYQQHELLITAAMR
jgi:nitrogen fixation/metabolism regulation signal transduction histidine kinase